MKDAQSLNNSLRDILNEPIAIIGLNCQFPGVTADIEDANAFHEMLLGKQTPIREVPKNRWDINSWYDADRQKEDKIVSRMGGFLKDPQLFDAAFFKIPPIEANQLDPQHRLFLEVSIRALNHANITLDSLKNSATGVYCGISTHDFCQQTIKDKVVFDASTYIGSADSAAAGRLAYFLKLKGPCLAVDTACSSSFSALYLATMALRNRQCDMAIVGGVHFNLSPDVFVGLSKANLLSAIGQCRSFDSEADGYVRSEGCGVVVIKRLSDALRDNNKIHAIIKSIVMNQNGGGSSMPAPHADAQIAMHQSALKQAGIPASEIDYIEAHGTGTLAGDSAECNAIQSIHEGHHSADNPLIIGALKSNLGHTISASGMASLIKVIEAFRHETIPANLHYTRPNTAINPDSIPALIPVEATAFAKNPRKRRYAQVSNFGFTGTNVNAILEEPPAMATNETIIPDSEDLCFVLSANSDVSLQHMLASYLSYLKKSPANPYDVCHTLINCRDHFKYRCAIIAQDKNELIGKMESGDYEFKQVTVDKSRRTIGADAGQIYEHYLAGANIKTGVAYNQIDLPLYYFDRKAYWYKETPAETELPEDWYFQLMWQEQSTNHHNFQKPGKRWLLMGAHHLASAFAQQGLDIVLAEDGEIFNNLDGIIFAEGFDVSLAEDSYARFALQKTILRQLLTLVQNLNANNIEIPLIVLTSNAIAELAVGNINLEASPLVGYCKTLVLELPQYRTVLIDLDTSDDKDVSARVIDEIQHNHGQQYEHMVAWRDGKRMVSRLRRDTNTLGPAVKPRGFGSDVNPRGFGVDVSAQEMGNSPSEFSGAHSEFPRLDRGTHENSANTMGRYLVTGGLGGLGLTSAEALLSHSAKEVILVSRTIDKPSAKDALQQMQRDYPDRVIRLVSLDITDKEGLKALLLESNSDGFLKGIIHAAGASASASLTEHKPEDIDYLLSAKVQGGWYLHELSQHCNLDFFIVYSSVSSVFGSNKESVYAAANSFLDALIAERRRMGLPGCAIQWGPWADVGMAKKRSQYQGLKQAFINKNQGRAFIQLMLDTHPPARTIISPDYLKFMLDFVPRPLPVFYQCLEEELTEAVKQSLAKTAPLPSWLANYFNMDETRQSAACKDLISSICKDILEIPKTDKLDDEESFSEIGLDSLMMTELASKINQALSLNTAITIAFDYPTISKLSQHIESELEHHPVKMQSASPPPQDVVVTNDAIAIIGMSCSFPEAADITAFEHMLENGLNGIRDIPPERWDNSQYYDVAPKTPDKSFINKLGLIDDIEYFDPGFFGISRREAPFVEPQQRLFLEQCSNAIEHANYPALSLRGSLTGVFAGTGSTQEYYTLLEKNGLPRNEPGLFPVTGKAMNMIPARVAYTFDFKGPALSIDTACSSSLVAIHYACQSLKNREIDYALAGGVNILLRPEGVVNLCNAQALSADGQCKTFDEQADGYVRAEGCGVLFLKRLADAVRDQDNILAVIKGSAINNDGKSAGLTMPNGKSQEEVMLKALNQAGLSSSDISYIEAHGTGTPLGDPIEVHAINKVYGSQRDKANPLYIGAVKTNIGHLESAAGVASMIKVILGLQKKKIYQTLNFHHLNPNIKIGDTRIALQQTSWHTPEKPNCAGVSAFGFSGTNAHVLLQDYPESVEQKTTHSTETGVLVLSAKSEAALDKLATRYRQFLKTTDSNFNDICFTAATCRDHHPCRLAIAASSAVEASQLLEQGADTSMDLQGKHELALLVANYLDGKQADWSSYYKKSAAHANKVNLPNYTFDRSKYWLDTTGHRNMVRQIIHPLLGQMLSMPGNEYVFHNQPDWDRLDYIHQYRIFDKAVFSTATCIESALAAARSILKEQAFSLEAFSIEQSLSPLQMKEFQIQAKPANDKQHNLHAFAKQDEHWQACFTSNMQVSTEIPGSADIATLRASFGKAVDIAHFYKQLEQSPLAYGPEFQSLQEAFASSNAALCKVVLTKAYGEQQYCYHPVVLESAIQSLLLINTAYDANTVWLPCAFERMTVFQDAPRTIWVHALRRDSEQDNEFCADLWFYDTAGLLIARIEGLRLRKTLQNQSLSGDAVLQHLYAIKWKPLNANILGAAQLPKLWVIGKEDSKARTLLGNVDYQLVDHMSKLGTVTDKHIVFLYEQQQFNELFHCCQQMFQFPPASFTLVTENAWAINDLSPDRVNPHHTMASAFWKSFRNELELQKNYTIDLSSGGTLRTALSYVFNTSSKETQFAVRDAIYVPRLEKEELSADTLPAQALFDREASYLITGGTGGLAKPLIDYLIRHGVKHIILTSRSESSPETLALIRDARKKQVNITHYSADVSNAQQMKQIIESANMLKGVFHLAGVIHDDLIVNLREETVEKVLKTKVMGALNLHELTQNIQLDLFVLFSSSASILGSRGQANYVAANGFLDGLAQLRQQQHLPALAINWGAFHTIGMAAKTSLALQRRGLILMGPESINALDILLPSRLSQLLVCPIHWDIYFHNTPKSSMFFKQVKQSRSPDPHFLTFLQQHNEKERTAILRQTLADIAADVLEFENSEEVGIKNDLFAMGMDSLTSLELRNRIHDKLQCPTLSLPIEYFINEPRIDKIALNIVHELHTILAPLQSQQQTEHASPESIALCDTQYQFWIVNKLAGSFNCAMQLQLQGKLHKEYLSQAFEFAINQHSVFWLDFSVDVPIQTLKRQGQFQLIYEDISSIYNADKVNDIFYKNVMRKISLSSQPLIRIYLYKLQQDHHELHIVIPHIILDNGSYRILFEQFKKNYDTLLQGKSLVPEPEAITYLDYVKQNNQHYEKDLTNKINFWKVYNQGFQRLSFDHAHHLPDAARQPKHLYHYPMDDQLITQFKNWHQDKNMNVSTGLIAACQIVFYRLSAEKKIPIIILHTGREGSRYRSVVGLFSEQKRINITLHEDYQFMDFLKSIEGELSKTASFQKCSQFIKNIGLRDAHMSIGQYCTYLYNKLALSKQFRKTRLHAITREYYLKNLSMPGWRLIKFKIKNKLNKTCKLKLPLLEPDRLRVLINITPSFFIKEPLDPQFSGLIATIPNHYGSVDRPVSNQTLWLYFTKDQYNNYRLSINGPLTVACKNQIAEDLKQVMSRVLENDQYRITDLIRD